MTIFLLAKETTASTQVDTQICNGSSFPYQVRLSDIKLDLNLQWKRSIEKDQGFAKGLDCLMHEKSYTESEVQIARYAQEQQAAFHASNRTVATEFLSSF